MTNPDFLARTFRLRAGRALALGALAMAAVAWIVSLPAVVGALIGGAPIALVMPRVKRATLGLTLLALVAVASAIAASLEFGPGARASRLLAALIASCAVVPWLVVVAVIRLHNVGPRAAP